VGVAELADQGGLGDLEPQARRLDLGVLEPREDAVDELGVAELGPERESGSTRCDRAAECRSRRASRSADRPESLRWFGRRPTVSPDVVRLLSLSE
jgi:hypothetical protein